MSSTEVIQEILTASGEDIASILSAIANAKRLQLALALLEGPRSFSDLQKVVKLGKTALAHHLGILVKTGVLTRSARGSYELSEDGFELVSAISTTYSRSIRRRKQKAAERLDYIRKTHTKEKERKMSQFKVNIVKLEPMLVASAQVISTTPEQDAWKKMHAWAEPQGLLEDLEKHPVFGFNNPNPSPGKKEYGYEFWIRIDPDIEPDGDIKKKKFEGGLYAVTTCHLKEEIESDFFKEHGYLESWKKIVDWVHSSKYKPGKHQCLEKSHDPTASEDELVLDLYAAIEE